MSLILALDQGTSSSRAIIFDAEGGIVGAAQRPLNQIFPRPGWVEHDPRKIWESQLVTAREAVAQAGVDIGDIAAIGIANQRETVLIWDRHTGEPIHNAIVWQDRRTADVVDRLKSDGHEAQVQEKTGLLLDPYFSAAKIGWLLDHVPEARLRAERGQLAAGTIDSWLLHRLTGGAAHMTDVTNASRTQLMNIHTGQWDDTLLELFDIPRSLLAEIRPSSAVLAETDSVCFGRPIPLAGVGGDQQAALFGQMCTSPGMAKNTYGTGCFLLLHTGHQPLSSACGLLTTTACQVGVGSKQYALEGSIFTTGAAIQWLRDGLGIIATAPEVNELASSVPDNGGVCVVPAFAGLGGAPLGPVGTWRHTGTDRGHLGSPHRTRHAGGDRLSGSRRARGNGKGRRSTDEGVARRRRCGGQQSADAAAGRPAGDASAATDRHRDNRGRGRLPGGTGCRCVEGRGGDLRPVASGAKIRAGHARAAEIGSTGAVATGTGALARLGAGGG